MVDIEFSYKGVDVAIDFTDEEHEHADITIEDRVFPATLHQGNLRMWACDEAYFVSPEITELAKHLIDYWYIITDPNTAPAEPHAHTPGHNGGGHDDHEHA